MTNANFPVMSVQTAFNASPGDATNIPVWVDLTGRTREITSAARGKQYETDTSMAGQANINLIDPDEALNPANSGSPYASTINLYRPFSVQAVWPASGSGNLLSWMDPGFEAAAVGGLPAGDINWSLLSGGFALVSSAQAWQGTHSLSIPLVTAASGTQGFRWRLLMVPGQQYTFSLYARQAVANNVRLGVATNFDQPPTTFVATSSAMTTTGAWTRITLTYTATQPLQQVWVYVNGAVTTDTLYVDGLQMEQGSSASTWTTTGARVYSVFRGYMERWPSTWQHAGTYGLTPGIAVDALAVLSQQELGTEVYNQTLVQTPTYYWTLQDDAASTSCAEGSGNNGPSLQIYQSPAGAGNGLQLGGSTPDLLGDPSGNRVTFNLGNNTYSPALVMDCELLNAGPAPGSSTSTGISPIPANPAAAWGATISAWAAATPVLDSKALPQSLLSSGVPTTGPAETIAGLVCQTTGNANQAQPLTMGLSGVNLIYYEDPGFEVQSAGSTPNNIGALLTGAMTVTAAQAAYGVHSAQFPVNGGSGLQGVYFTAFTLEANTQYTYSVAVRQTVANTMTVGVASTTSNPPTGWLATGTSTTATNTWVTLKVTFTTGNAGNYNMWLYSSAPGSTGTAYIDGAQLEFGPSASAWSNLCYAPTATYLGPNGSLLVAVATGINQSDSKMHHYMATVSQDPAANTTVTLYVDGPQVATATATTASLGGALPAGATGVQVGGQANIDWIGQSWCGQITHVALWNNAQPSGTANNIAFAGLNAYDQEHSGDRARRYIGYALPGDLLYTDTGASQMGPGIVTAGTSALQAVQDIATSENGNLYVDSEGRVIFAARTRKYTNTTPKWVLGELESPYQGDIGFDFDPSLVYNDWTVTRTNGTVVHVADGPSKKANFPRNNTRELNIHSDSETVDAANFLLNTYKTPQQRVQQISLDPASNPALWPVVLGIEIGDRVTVKRRTATFTMQADFFVEKVQNDLSINGDTLSWRTQLQMSPAARYAVWIIGDSTYGVIGSTTKIGY